MVVGRQQLRSRLSIWRASIIQWIDGRRLLAPALLRIAPRQLLRFAPRGQPLLSTLLADLARPIRFPQHGRGSAAIDAVPALDSKEFRRLVFRARRKNEVRIDAAMISACDAGDAILVLAAAGVPLALADESVAVEDQLGVDLAREFGTATSADPLERELRSVRLRRLAHDRLWQSSSVREVSVLLASRRPDDLESAIRRVRSQVGCTPQILVGLHGDAWRDDVSAVADLLPDGSSIRRFDARVSLGEVLTSLTEAADAEIVTKWDDDDWYGPDHLMDLVRSYDYSGADVVGKAAEFVYLEANDLTIRRFTVGAESYSSTLAGGTLLTSRSWLGEIGQWPDVRKGVDRAMLDATRRAGGATYRTHGFQYVLRRRNDQPHTWTVDDDHFVGAASERRPGLDLHFADVEEPA